MRLSSCLQGRRGNRIIIIIRLLCCAVLCCAFPFLVVDDVVMNNKGAWREVIVTVSFLVSVVRKRSSGENKRF